MRDAAGAWETGHRETANLQARINQAQKAHQALLENPPQTGVLDLLKRFDAHALAPAAATATQAIASAENVLEQALDSISVGACSFSAVPDSPADTSAAESIAQQHADLTEKIGRFEDSLERLDEDIAALKAKTIRISEEAGISSDQEEREARTRRDTLWQAHRKTLTSESADSFRNCNRRVVGGLMIC
jgi:uncharacterized membrane protein YccC